MKKIYNQKIFLKASSQNEVKSSDLKPEILRKFIPEYFDGNKEIWNYNSIDK